MDYTSNRSPRRIREEEKKRLLTAIEDALNAWPPSQDSDRDRTPSALAIRFREPQEGLPSQTKRNASSTRPDPPRPATPSPDDDPFDDRNSTEQWRCPRCNAEGDTWSELVENLDQTGQLVFRCKWAFCNAQLLAQRKHSGTGKRDPGDTDHACPHAR